MIKNNNKRICIYFIYDREGIVDEYIIYQLRKIHGYVDFIHCVINGKVEKNSYTKLAEVTDEIYERENKGNDIGAYKDAIKHIGWKQINQYNELIIMNNTCFGPVYSFQEIFQWAEAQKVDFWGLTLDTKSSWSLGEYLHKNNSKTHYQSNFLCLRKSLFKHELLKNFFDEIPEDTSYTQSGLFFEYAFPGYFEEHGFKGAVYCNDLTDLDYPLLHNPVSLMKRYRMPLFKKRSFFHHYTDVLNHSAGEATARLLKFLEEETNYDTSLIWPSILRNCNLSDVVKCAQLNRVLPRDIITTVGKKYNDIGVVFHLFYEDLFVEYVQYLANFPQEADILITTTSEEKKQQLIKLLKDFHISANVLVIPNRGRDVSSLLVAAKNFVLKHKLICFAHDKKSTQIKVQGVGRSWAYKLNENTFASKEFVLNVINMFENERNLGIAFPSYPNHSFFANDIGTGWTGNYIYTKKLLDAFEINVKIHEHALCVAPLGTCFWFRPEAIKKLYDGLEGNGWCYEDFPAEPNKVDHTILHAIERSYAYFAQAAGYYPVFLYNDKWTQIELTNLEFNKTGSTEMRAWTEALIMDSLGIKNLEDNETVASDYNDNINYGIKRSLKHLAMAIRCKYPVFWSSLLPIRRLGQKILGIK